MRSKPRDLHGAHPGGCALFCFLAPEIVVGDVMVSWRADEKFEMAGGGLELFGNEHHLFGADWAQGNGSGQ